MSAKRDNLIARPGRRPRVLVVEDDVTIGHLVVSFLRTVCDTALATDGAQAVELVRRGDSFDAVLLDLMLPYLNGREVFAFLVAHKPELARRTVVMTGGGVDQPDLCALRAAGLAFLLKPFSADDLLTAMRRVLE